jgi:hypothetical protein
MRANPFYYGQVLWRVTASAMRPVTSGISVALLLGGCATHPPLGVTCGNVPPLSEPLRLQLGAIALVSPNQPAQVSFDQPAGQIASFGDVASEAAAALLNPSGFGGDPGNLAVAGVGGFLAAPIVGVVAGSSSAHQRLGPDKLSLCESNLLAAMKTMAAQERFRDCLVQAAKANTRRRLLLPEPTAAPGIPCPGADAVLETQVQQLRLERTGKGDTSYALRIEAKARLLRTADRSVLYEAPLNWRSDTCLFLDWTRSDAFQKVAQTAYREMAERVVSQLFVATPEGPLLAGAGNQEALARRAKATALVANRGSLRRTDLQPVSYPALNTGTIGVCPTEEVFGILVQTPPTRDEAAVEAVQDMNWAFDGFYNSPNPMLALPAMAVGIPVGLWKQGAAVVCGPSERHLKQADRQLYVATRGLHPHQQLAMEVAQTLSAQTAQMVVLMRPPSPGAGPESALVQCVARTPTGQPNGQFVTGDATRLQPDTVLEIHVANATLEAKSSLNPGMALCVEVQARLLRASDGAELYACPVHYRSQARKFTQWGAHEAQLFRQELQACYREVGATVATQLVARHLVQPNPGSGSLVAGN